MPSKRTVEQCTDDTGTDAATCQEEGKSETAIIKQKPKVGMTALQRKGSESPSKKTKVKEAFTKEEDEIIIKHLMRDKDMPGIKKLLPNRSESSLRCRVDLLMKKIRACAGS